MTMTLTKKPKRDLDDTCGTHDHDHDHDLDPELHRQTKADERSFAGEDPDP